MKKTEKILLGLAFIISAIILFTSCEKDDVECKCKLEVTIDGSNSYYVVGVPTDCNGNYDRPNNVPPEHFIIGISNCQEQ